MEVKINRNKVDARAVYARCEEIILAIAPEQSLSAECEWSALIGAAATLMAASCGIDPSLENLSKIGIRAAEAIGREFAEDFEAGRLLR